MVRIRFGFSITLDMAVSSMPAAIEMITALRPTSPTNSCKTSKICFGFTPSTIKSASPAIKALASLATSVESAEMPRSRQALALSSLLVVALISSLG